MRIGKKGCSVNEKQPAINVLVVPTSLRSTGVFRSPGIGRSGSMIGPLIAAELMLLNWSNAGLFPVMAIATQRPSSWPHG
jgi:hypothetical protein